MADGLSPAQARRHLLTLAGTAGVAAAGLGVMWLVRGQPLEAGRMDTTRVSKPDDPASFALGLGRPAVIQFGANVCAACRSMKLVLDALQHEHGTRFSVMSVDLVAQKHRGYLQRFRIHLMPTQVFFDAGGLEAYRNLGTMTASDILARLEGMA